MPDKNINRTEVRTGEGGVFSSGMDMLTRSLKAVFALMVAVIALLLIWFFIFSGFFIVKPDTNVITLRFGEFKELYRDGWHWVFPYPVSSIIEVPTKPMIVRSNTFMPADPKLITDPKTAQGKTALQPGVDGYLLTADACIIHTAWEMTYRISDPKRYYENCMTPTSPKDPDVEIKGPDGFSAGTRGPQTLLRSALDNAVVCVTARWKVNDIIFVGRGNEYIREVEALVRRKIDDMRIGVDVLSLSLTSKSPPPQTVDAFNEVLLAETEGETEKKKAEAYAIEQQAIAQSESTRISAEAENYKIRIVTEVEADAVYFNRILKEYRKNKSAVTISLFTTAVADAMLNVKDKFILNSIQSGKQELRLKLNPEPASPNDKAAVPGQKKKEAGK